jgi:formylmethanofuran dehydrogenase subunit E
MKTFQQWLEIKESSWTTLAKEKINCVKCGEPAQAFSTGGPLCKNCKSKETTKPKPSK